jgi:hypothetical protein
MTYLDVCLRDRLMNADSSVLRIPPIRDAKQTLEENRRANFARRGVPEHPFQHVTLLTDILLPAWVFG